MNSDMIEILKAKRDALEALELAMADQVRAGHIASGESALRFVKTWSQAVDAMVPAEMEKTVMGILPNAHCCTGCSFVTASAELMDGHMRVTGHLSEGMATAVSKSPLQESEEIHYRPADMGQSACGIDIDRTPYTYASPVRSEVTCKDCLS
jgi:hypothetical protein